eukprot:9258813-Pyramimonas_sp.AAC.1
MWPRPAVAKQTLSFLTQRSLMFDVCTDLRCRFGAQAISCFRNAVVRGLAAGRAMDSDEELDRVLSIVQH